MNNSIIILDIETTGFSYLKNEITEIGAIKVDLTTYEIIDEFSTLLKINSNVSTHITRLTGITDRMLDNNGITLSSGLILLEKFCLNSDVYAHNAPFDMGFIRHNLDILNISYTKTNWIDTITLFKKHAPGRKSYTLTSLIRDYGINRSVEHRALSDVINTYKLLKIIVFA